MLNYGTDPNAEYVLVCGTRTFTDYKLLKEKLDLYTFWFDPVIVVHGGNREKIGWRKYAGADYLADEWARHNMYTRIIFHPDWKEHKKAAGPIRNTEMVEFVKNKKGYAVAFWDGESSGTYDVITKVKKAKIPLRIVRYA